MRNTQEAGGKTRVPAKPQAWRERGGTARNADFCREAKGAKRASSDDVGVWKG